MKAIDRFDRWAARARQEAVPEPQTAEAVMRRLRRPKSPVIVNAPAWMWVASAASVAAALVCGVLGYLAWVEMNAPGVAWLQEFSNWGVM